MFVSLISANQYWVVYLKKQNLQLILLTFLNISEAADSLLLVVLYEVVLSFVTIVRWTYWRVYAVLDWLLTSYSNVIAFLRNPKTQNARDFLLLNITLRALLFICDYRKAVFYGFILRVRWLVACMLLFFSFCRPLLAVVAKIEAQSSTEFTACCNNKPGSVVSIDMGGVNKDCINTWDASA